jgi:hypothetical protein
MKKRKYSPRRRLERVSVQAEYRTEPDWDRFAWALLQHARLIKQATKDQAGDKTKSQTK